MPKKNESRVRKGLFLKIKERSEYHFKKIFERNNR